MILNKIVIVEERDNPSTDYFVLPQIVDQNLHIKKYTFNQLPEVYELDAAVIIIIRYLPKKWRNLIEKNRTLIKELYYFMDDDLFDLSATKGQPLKYRWKLFRLSYLYQGWIKRNYAKLWVSNNFLAHKYTSYQPDTVFPYPLEFQINKSSELLQNKAAVDSEKITIFYHGSASHQVEIDWLAEVIQQVLEVCPNAWFEMIGTEQMARLFKDFARVTVVPPMQWGEYQSFIQKPGRHIGLAPVLDTPFNRARSYTKFFDITSAGAAGVYPEKSAFSEFVAQQAMEANEVGSFVSMDKQAWIEAIIDLVKYPEKREAKARAAQNLLLTLAKPNARFSKG